uniref:G_PROTEIN_RECEP_F1_2 domain-containing protein n=1 Tax=Angiostrongylus cantonensis TaxID=6313 RepID=A0A158P8S2_ANGCA
MLAVMMFVIVLQSLHLGATQLSKTVPLVFRNCSNIFIPGKDEKYALCNITTGDTPCALLEELHKAKEFRIYGFTVVPIALSSLAMILNITYLAIQLKIYRKEEESTRKRYLFLISRSLSTVMALILLYVVNICWKANGFAYNSAMIFLLLGGLNFLSITGTYIALTILLYTAIVHPFFYQSNTTIKHCYIIIAFIWLISTLASSAVGLWGATLFYPESAPVRCTFRGCQKPLAILIVSGLSLSYATVLGLYAVLIIRLHMKLRSSREVIVGNVQCESNMERQLIHIRAMNRLGMNMVTFAVGSIPILIVCIVALVNLRSLSSLGEGEKSPCKTYLNSRLFVEVELLASSAGVVWLLAMILDPIINTVADQKIMAMLYDWVRTHIRIIAILSNNYEVDQTEIRGEYGKGYGRRQE